jgi:hypothetical protein
MADEVEPVDGEVVQNQVVDVLEWRSGRPSVVPVNADVNAEHVADQSGPHGLADVGEVGAQRPF